MHLAILSKDIFLDLFLELLLGDEIVFSPMNLSLPWSTGCVADRKFKCFRVFFQQELYQCTFADSWATTDNQRLMSLNIFVVVEECEKFLGILIDIIRLLQQTRTQKIIQDLPELWMTLEIVNMLLLDSLLDGPKISLELRVKIFFVFLHDVEQKYITFVRERAHFLYPSNQDFFINFFGSFFFRGGFSSPGWSCWMRTHHFSGFLLLSFCAWWMITGLLAISLA